MSKVCLIFVQYLSIVCLSPKFVEFLSTECGIQSALWHVQSLPMSAPTEAPYKYSDGEAMTAYLLDDQFGENA